MAEYPRLVHPIKVISLHGTCLTVAAIQGKNNKPPPAKQHILKNTGSYCEEIFLDCTVKWAKQMTPHNASRSPFQFGPDPAPRSSASTSTPVSATTNPANFPTVSRSCPSLRANSRTARGTSAPT